MRHRPIDPETAEAALAPHLDALAQRLGRPPRALSVHAAPTWRHVMAKLELVGHVAAGRPVDGEAHRLPADDRSVDVVLAAYLAIDPTRLERALDEIHRVLRPGGLLLVLESAGRRHDRRLETALQARFEGPDRRGKERFPRVRREVIGRQRALFVAHRRGRTIGHFDNLAEEYRGEMPEHLVDLYREKKLHRILGQVRAAELGPTLRGLDLGCGVGMYTADVAEALEADMVAVDASAPSLQVARAEHPHQRVRHAVTDATRLPFPTGGFDFAYTINLLHHLKRSEQRDAMAELARVIRPGGILLVFEIHVGNPLFRWYMRKVFPYSRRIDRGDEEFISPDALPLGADFEVDTVQTYTFVPDFLPRPLMAPARFVEGLVEKTPLARFGIHQTVVLRRPMSANGAVPTDKREAQVVSA